MHVYETVVGLLAYDLSARGNIFVAQMLFSGWLYMYIIQRPTLKYNINMKTSQLQLRTAKYTCKPLLGAYNVFLASVDQYRAIPETRNFNLEFALYYKQGY